MRFVTRPSFTSGSEAPTRGVGRRAVHWDQAACRGMSLDVFFESDDGATDRARAVCVRCPIMGLCRDFAVATRQEFGIWGGSTPSERKAIHRRERYDRTGV